MPISYQSTLCTEDFSKKPANSLLKAFPEIALKIRTSLGKTLERSYLYEAIVEASEGIRDVSDRSIIGIHNWTKEILGTKPDYDFDWSNDFDRVERKIPSPNTWKKYQDELSNLKKTILSKTASRSILFQGKVTLSTAILFGATFPQNGGWTIDFFQSQVCAEWSSSAKASFDFEVYSNELELFNNGDSLALVCDITGRGIDDVKTYINDSNLCVKSILSVSPKEGTGSLSIKTNQEAVSFALQSIDFLRSKLKELRLKKVHLFYYGPSSIALFIGQRLTSLGVVTTYEYQDPNYISSCTFRT